MNPAANEPFTTNVDGQDGAEAIEVSLTEQTIPLNAWFPVFKKVMDCVVFQLLPAFKVAVKLEGSAVKDQVGVGDGAVVLKTPVELVAEAQTFNELQLQTR